MQSNFTNLVPSDRRHGLARDYYLRLGVIVLLSITVITVISAILLIPTYVYLNGSIGAKQTHLKVVEKAFTAANDASLSARLTALSSSTQAISALAEGPTASELIRSLLSISRPGITLSGVMYTPAQSKTSKTRGTLSVSGTAATRDALRNYQLALQGASFARSADLPVSAYAQDSNINFTITVTLSL